MSNPKSALVLSGGGARGAYQVGVLKALAEVVPENAQPFDIITGVSVGALNAVVLAARGDDFHAGVHDLENIWRNLHCHNVYHIETGAIAGQVLRWIRALLFGWAGAHPPRSFLNNAPLRTLLNTHVDFTRLNKLVGTHDLEALAITASSYETGRAVTFFQSAGEIKPWTRARRVGRRREITADHVMASSALPLVFPSVKIEGVYFGDGALRENAPLSAAIHLGCEHIVTIGARDKRPDPDLDLDMPYPTLGYLTGQMLDILFNDHADADVERLTRINKTISLMSEQERERTNLKEIGLASVNPSRDVRLIAGEHVDELPSSVKFVLKAMGAYKSPWVLPSYLAFEPGYLSALIDLGYEDGKKQQAELLAQSQPSQTAFSAD